MHHRYISLIVLFCTLLLTSCDNSEKKVVATEVTSSGITTGEVVVGGEPNYTSSFRLRKGRADRISDVWQQILQNNEALAREVDELRKLADLVFRQRIDTKLKIREYESYTSSITGRIDDKIKDTLLRKQLLQEVALKTAALNAQADQLRAEVAASEKLLAAHEDYLTALKLTTVNQLMESYFAEDLVVEQEVKAKREELKEALRIFGERNPVTFR